MKQILFILCSFVAVTGLKAQHCGWDNSKIIIVEGAQGAGKTTIVNAIIDIMHSNGLTVCIIRKNRKQHAPENSKIRISISVIIWATFLFMTPICGSLMELPRSRSGRSWIRRVSQKAVPSGGIGRKIILSEKFLPQTKKLWFQVTLRKTVFWRYCSTIPMMLCQSS